MSAHVCDTCRDQPGSDTAREKGCTCPVMDNWRGHNEHWQITREGCPLHWPDGEAAEDTPRTASPECVRKATS